MARILVIRLSALGDVAISVPLVQGLAEQYPEHEFVVLSQPKMGGLFESCPSNVLFVPADVYGKHRGFWGLFRLYRQLHSMGIDVICDMHSVIRTRVLTAFFGVHRIPVFRIGKERKHRQALTRRKNKVFKPLKTSFERYRDVFAKAGLSLTYFDAWPKMEPSLADLPEMEARFGAKKSIWLGYAPFARHQGKIYPLEHSDKVIARLATDPRFTVFLFGGGKEETQRMKQWQDQYPSLQIPACRSLSEEIQLMKCLDVMVAMDSANMHLGSLAHTPVISVWGATHPYAGFYGLFQTEKNAIQLPLECRPCSVFGNKPCYRKDYACMNEIRPEQIIEKVYQECGL
jgi:ADP-heptose:LPS heptosyltransferase